MRDEKKTIRQKQIEQAAYAVLQEKGYAGTSMLAIARKARASNETLYNWYGDKVGLFKALVARNAHEIRAMLETRIKSESDALDTLTVLGPMLLAVLTGARAVALNRAAAADPSGDLGQAISAEGRETIAPLITQVLLQARDQGKLNFPDPGEAVELYLNLLIGDLQIRRVIGRAPEPTDKERKRRSNQAVDALVRLLPP
ncbi:MAG: TetR/AcrR family transcriptional regulator [Rhizobiales bacterium]|nr:TetR/AcrR family transcriptional regulator [Hyphomicrobiales bacterium]